MKLVLKYLCLCIMLVTLPGCFLKKDDFDNIEIYTTIYTIEYISKTLYGNHAKISSIYPDGIDIPSYTITNKKINDYSNGDLFIYNGLSNEKQIAAALINKNKKMYIIDVSQGLEIKHEESELWISPTNCLMIAQNIKNGLKEHITNKSILDEIDGNYDNLKLIISSYDAEFKYVAENAVNKTLIVANKAFSFLNKYGFEVINISDNDEETSTTVLAKARKAFTNKDNHYIFMLNGTEETDTIKALMQHGAKISYINPMINLTDHERSNNDNYKTFMNAFIEAIKAEVY